ncbi:hypothetical protein NUACC26_056260 [Scytonema sp. NUACC26]
MTFQELQIGDYFRIPGMNSALVYRKANSFQCSHSALLQPIRSETTVIPLSPAEVTNYFAKKREDIKSLIK